MNRIGDRLRIVPVAQTTAVPRRHDVPGRVTPAWPALIAWLAVIVAARLVLVDLVDSGAHLRIPFPPLDAALDWRPGWALLLPATVGLVAVVAGARWAREARWTRLVVGASLSAAIWGISLALLDGTHGIVGSVTLKNEYFLDVSRVGDPLRFLREFAGHLAEYRIHVQGHPPGYLLLLSGLDRVGLGSPWVVAGIEIAAASSAVAAVLLAVREVASEAAARAAAPFVALAPIAIWTTTSADAFYLGVGAWAVALVVLATGTRGSRARSCAVGGGLLFGVTAFLSYGLVLLALVPLGVAICRRRVRVLVHAAAAASTVFVAFALAGFWWFDGLAATHDRYAAGVASRRPYWPFLLANVACLAIALGPAIAVALGRQRDRRLWLLIGGALAAIAIAALSGMSKGEVERIWLPFAVWVLPAGAVLAGGRRAGAWLSVQVVFTMFVQTLVRSPW
jgi:hypothetical protein